MVINYNNFEGSTLNCVGFVFLTKKNERIFFWKATDYLFETHVIDWLLATKNQTKTPQMLRCGFNLVNRIIHLAGQRGIERRDKNTIYE